MPVIDRGTCPVDGAENQLLYFLEPTDHELGLACPECCRKRARTVNRTTPCDKCGAQGAWRNPRTRRDEFLCGTHHAESGDGVLLNLDFARVSAVHSKGRKASCEIGHDCRGEVKPRNVAGVSHLLCTKHAGKTSALWAVEDKEV